MRLLHHPPLSGRLSQSLLLLRCSGSYCVNRKLEVQMPRFLLERSYSLRDALNMLDVSQLFQDDAELSELGGARGLKLSQVGGARLLLELLLELNMT